MSLKLEVGIFARDGKKRKSGKKVRRRSLMQSYTFEVRDQSGEPVDPDGKWWAKWKDKLTEMLSESVIQRAVDDDDLPLPTQYLTIRPTGPDPDDLSVYAVIWNDYLIKCIACESGMSEETETGVCFDCTEGNRTHTG